MHAVMDLPAVVCKLLLETTSGRVRHYSISKAAPPLNNYAAAVAAAAASAIAPAPAAALTAAAALPLAPSAAAVLAVAAASQLRETVDRDTCWAWR